MGTIHITDPTTIAILILCVLCVLFAASMIYLRFQRIRQRKKESRTKVGEDSPPIGGEEDEQTLRVTEQNIENVLERLAQTAQTGPRAQDTRRTPSLQRSEYLWPRIAHERTARMSLAYPESSFRLSTLPSYPGTLRSMSPPAYSDLSRAQSWRTQEENTGPTSAGVAIEPLAGRSW